MQNRTESSTSIWLALAGALGLHALILFLPLSRQIPLTEPIPAQIELQLTTFSPQAPAPEVPEIEPNIEPPVAIIEPEKHIAEVKPEVVQPAPPTVSPDEIQVLDPVIQNIPERRRPTSTILSAQFITEESAADKLFGKPLELPDSGQQKDFHSPGRQDMVSMLDQPLPDLPFAYTPGLVRFAYDPGVKGDLQRFWDVITPEFGWRTDNGTEFRCVWVLIIAACGWK